MSLSKVLRIDAAHVPRQGRREHAEIDQRRHFVQQPVLSNHVRRLKQRARKLHLPRNGDALLIGGRDHGQSCQAGRELDHHGSDAPRLH